MARRTALNRPDRRSILRRILALAVPLLCGVAVAGAAAQDVPAPPAASSAAPAAKPATKPTTAKKSHSVSGSPLDTLRSSHLWADTAPAQDFVRDSRPDAKTLDYAPLTGTDPVRPKPRDAANVLALQAELEKARTVNEGKGRRLGALKPAKSAAAR